MRAILAAAFLWATCVLVTWPSLRSHRDLEVVAIGVAVLLLGVAVLLFGVAVLRDGQTLFGVAGLLLGVALLLLGVAVLRDQHRAEWSAASARLLAWLKQR